MAPPNRKNTPPHSQRRSSSRLDSFRTDLAMMPEERSPSSSTADPLAFSPPLPSVTTTTTTTTSSPGSTSEKDDDDDPSTFPPAYSPSPSSSSAASSSSGDSSSPSPPPTHPSARRAVAVPRASPKVPTYEYYGFVLYVGSSVGFAMCALWAYLPSPFLHQLGIDYYPNRWWALALPAELVAAVVYIYVALAAYNTGALTLPMGSVENIVDAAADVAVLDAGGRVVRKGKGAAAAAAVQRRGGEKGWEGTWAARWSEGTDAVMDVPVGGVCEILYGDG
ncbi:hypothetical protein MMC15_001104 [Xylographa vitiligo]|nr:hypothetical protein [Xylographa vitiligo]